MREILFRGKSLETGEWVEGDPIHSKRMAGGFNEYRIRNQETGMETDIDPETRCEFTGETDIEGHNLFEHDIVEFDNLGNQKELFVIVYYRCCFTAESINYNVPQAERVHFNWTRFCQINHKPYKPKRIGNIFDNPELIKKV